MASMIIKGLNRCVVIFTLLGFSSQAISSSEVSDLYNLENEYERTYQEFARVKYDLNFISTHKTNESAAKAHWTSKHYSVKNDLADQYRYIGEFKKKSSFIKTNDVKYSEKYNQSFEICPNYIGRTRLESHFLTSQYGRQSCVYEMNPNSLKILSNEKVAFDLKVRSLLGRSLPKEMLKTGNPYLPLNFSKAPKLNEILISALVFEKDFSGVVLTRLLKYHAKKDTKISIIVANALVTRKTRRLFDGLKKEFRSVRVKYFKYNSVGRHRSRTALSKFHKVNHIKIFSVKGENIDLVYTGGRNIHDGFLFDAPLDHSEFPDLTQRSQTKYSKWVDMDLEISNRKVNAAIRRQFKSFENLHQEDMYSNITSLFIGDRKNKTFKSNKYYTRHFMSVPYSDQLARTKKDISKTNGAYIGSLEKYKVQLIDSSTKEIKLVSPYLNLTKNIYEAFERAIKRGVRVQILTRINLEGDTADAILTDVNKKMINHLYKKVELYEYLTPKKILHSKIMMVDKKLTIVGSVNYNKRSFIHDTENFTAIWSPIFYKKMNSIFSEYKKDSKRIRAKQTATKFNSIIIDTFETYF